MIILSNVGQTLLIGLAVIAIIIVVIVIANIKIVSQTNAYVIERLGRYHRTWDTGVHFLVPFIDEFIIDEGVKKYYLSNEVEVFLNLIETIARMRNIKVFLLGNAGNLITNPYFLYFGLSIPTQNDIRTFKDGLVLVQYMKNDEYRKKKQETKFGKLVSGTNYEKFAILNQDNKINNDFIEKKKATSRFNFAFIYQGAVFGVWFDFQEGKIFVSSDYYKSSPNIFALTTRDHTENTMLMKSINKYQCWKKFIDNYEIGNVRFESVQIKQKTEN